MKDDFSWILSDGDDLEEALDEYQSEVSNPTGMQRRHNWIRQIEKAGEQQEEDQDG